MSDEILDTAQSAPAAGAIEVAPFHISDEEIAHITAAARAQDSDTVHSILKELKPVDIAELLAKVTDEERRELLSMYGDSIDPLAFSEMDYELRRLVLSAMPARHVASLISRMESDDALDMIINLDEDFRKDIIKKLSSKMRLAMEEGLSYPEDSAGRLMQREFVAAPQFWTVGKTIDYLREAANDLPEDFLDLFVITPSYNIVGHIPLNRLVRAKRSTKLESLVMDDTHTIPADMDQEQVAMIFRRENITSAPVVDENNRLIGVVTIDDVIDVIDEEAQEDLLKLAGVEKGDLYRAAITTTEIRFRWLFINLLTAFLAAWVVSFFSVTIEKIVALAVLMPIVAGMGGNAGTQTLAVAVRALATRELSGSNTWRVVGKETLVGLLNGIAFAIITGFAAGLWFQDSMIGVIIGAAMIINLVAAGFFGILIPIALNKWGSDPAVSSTVFLTTVTDIVGFLAFLGLAAMFLIPH
jgi:magnesium transporter